VKNVVLLVFLCFEIFCYKKNPINIDNSELKKPYKRILTANLFSSEIVYYLGDNAVGKLIGVSALVDDKTFSNTVNHWPSIIKRFNGKFEELFVLQPDLIIVADFQDIYQKYNLDKYNFNYLLLKPLTGYKNYFENIRLIAAAFQNKPKGEELITGFLKKEKRIKNRVKHIKKHKTIVTYISGYSAGTQTTFNDIAETAGFINMAAENGFIQHKLLPLEKLILWNPDIIVLSADKNNLTEAENQFRKLPGVGKMSAVNNQGVIAIPMNLLSSTDDRMLDVAEILQNRVYLNEK